jgi:hypothetical protein
MELYSGKMYATVPPRAKGFTVMAGGSKILDLGTEFGVELDDGGNTQLHVTKGKTELFTEFLTSNKPPIKVNAGAAKKVYNDGLVTDIPVAKGKFALGIDSKSDLVLRDLKILNLADVIGGGDGFGTGKIDHVIDLDTGLVSPRSLNPLTRSQTQPPVRCIAAEKLPFVDCLFVPDGGIGVDQISIDGVRFENCPDTSGNSWGNISNGGILRLQNGSTNTLVLDGVTYGTQQRPAIFIHSNLGVTFDLDQIRKSNPGFENFRFTSLCGISQTVKDTQAFREPITSFYVLVDGKVRFSKERARLSDKASVISIDLTEKDRYLSLVVTDADGNVGQDWGVFAMPRLIFK